MFAGPLHQLSDELTVIRTARRRKAMDRSTAIEKFSRCAASQSLAIASGAADWQEAILHQHPHLERAVDWSEIEPSALGDALAERRLTEAVAVLRRWARAFARSVRFSHVSEAEMATVAVASEDARDLADSLECGERDDPDVGPARTQLPPALRRMAGGARVTIHPKVYVELVAHCCAIFGWHELPCSDAAWIDVEVEPVVAEGVAPAVAVLDWLGARRRIERLRADIDRRLDQLRSEPPVF
jgi:hypothetical protein